jgi:predicted ribosomally synthesized peptide with SipW-like signal peptide
MIKIAKSLFIVLAVSVISIGVTSASWTDVATVENNVFSTGYLDLATNPESAVFYAEGIYPGWSETQVLDVQNTGSIPLVYDLSVNKADGSDDLYYSEDFYLTIGTYEGGNDIYEGPMSGMTGLNSVRELDSGNSETLYFTVSLGTDAGNGLQNQSVNCTFQFVATQP